MEDNDAAMIKLGSMPSSYRAELEFSNFANSQCVATTYNLRMLLNAAAAPRMTAERIVVRRINLPIITAALALAQPASAVNLCGVSDPFDLSNIGILPFGGEIIGASTAVGEIINTHVDIQFTATGVFSAADIAVSFEIHDASGGVGVSFSGAQLGWSGQGTFIHQFDTASLNGLLYPGNQPFSTVIISMANLNPGNGPITGNFDRLIYTIEFGRCPLGDVNHDLDVNVTDLLAVIASWGPCLMPPAACPADVNGSGAVDVADLLTVITNWGTFCPKCS